ncbi:MAG: tetratricopeptide repeat protein [Saprospiraceae bacterium]
MIKTLKIFLCLIILLLQYPNIVIANGIDKAMLEEARKKSHKELLILAEENTHRNFDLAIAYTELAESKAKKAYNNDNTFEALKQRGRIYEFNNLLLEALMTYQQAEEIANVNNDDKQRSSIYTDIAITHRRLSNYSKARKYHLDALYIAERTDDKQGIENSYYGLATLHKNLASFGKALEYYNKVVISTKESGNTYRMLNTRQYVATTYSEAGQYDLAIKEIKETFKAAIELNDSLLIGTIAFDYGKILSGQGKTQEALDKYLFSLDIFEELNHKPLLSRSLFYVGDTYATLENYNQAGKYFETCQSYKRYMSFKSLSDLEYRLGQLYIKLGQSKMAESSFLESLEIAEKNNLKELCQKNHHGLYEVYHDNNDLPKALFHLDKSTAFKDSILTDIELKTIRELNFQEEVRASDEQIAELQAQRKNITIFSSIAVLTLVVGFLSILLYINRRSTEQLKQKNEEIRNQNVKLRESNEVLHQFTYVAAHDLKEPVRNIGSFISLLKRRFGKDFNDEAKQYMDFVMKGAKRINTLLNDLENYTSISLQPPLEAVVEPMKSIETAIFDSPFHITEENIFIEGQLPNVKMSNKHLTILFKELLGNSLKFNKSDVPKITISAKNKDDLVQFKVSDNGIGIPPENQLKVFNLFYRTEKNWEDDGTGIGLTISKNIVDKYDGEIWFESKPNEGTTFFMTLPAA